MKAKTRLTLALALSAALSGWAFAQNTVPAPNDTSATSVGNPEPMRPAAAGALIPAKPDTPAIGEDKASAMDRVQLRQALESVTDRSGYEQAIEQQGFSITRTNQQSKELVEYEVVRDGQSYEVQLQFDAGSSRADKIDVGSNFWRASETKEQMSGDSGAPPKTTN